MVVAFLTVTAQTQPGIWSDHYNISNNSGASRFQDIAIDTENSIHLVWEDNTRFGGGPFNGDIIYSYFDGQNWADSVLISSLEVIDSWHPRIAVDSQNQPHIVWIDHGSSNPNIFYSYRQDTAWTEPINLSGGTYGNYEPDIAVDFLNHVHVVWHGVVSSGYDILYRSFDGEQWLEIENITPEPGYCLGPRIVADSQAHLHLT